MATPEAIQKFVIVGGGSAGWMTAASMANDLDKACEIHLVESEAIGTIGVGEATIPPIIKFNNRLGIDEQTFLSATRGTYKLGIEFIDWARKGESYFHPFGNFGPQIGKVGLHHHWLRSRAHGDTSPFCDLSINWAMASRNRFALPKPAGPILGQSAYAYHFDASLYAGLLRRYAEERGVIRHEGEIVDVTLRPDNGFVEKLTLSDGREIAGDFFFDCSGQRGLLIEGALKAGYDDWSHYLPCNSAVAVQSELAGELLPYTRSQALDAGWQWRIPLQHRTGNGHVYCSEFISDEAATNSLLENLDGEPINSPRLIRFKTGRRKQAWSKNVLAIGLSAGFLEPLESTSLHLIQTGIARFRRLMPFRDCDPLLAAEYNRHTESEYEYIRDFLVLHYKATQREDSDFWRQCRNMAIPDSLQQKMALFVATANVYTEQENLFKQSSWLAVYLGQNILPERYDPRLDLRSPAPVSKEALAALRNQLATAAQSQMPHSAFIERRRYPASVS